VTAARAADVRWTVLPQQGVHNAGGRVQVAVGRGGLGTPGRCGFLVRARQQGLIVELVRQPRIALQRLVRRMLQLGCHPWIGESGACQFPGEFPQRLAVGRVDAHQLPLERMHLGGGGDGEQRVPGRADHRAVRGQQA